MFNFFFPFSSYDVIVYAATPAGIAGAIAARVSGAQSVLLIEPTSYVGGMASPGGIGLRDCVKDEIRINNSTQYLWAMRNAAFYGTTEPVWQPDNWLGELNFRNMLNDYDVELRLNTNFVEGRDGVKTAIENGERRITEIILETGETLAAKYFIDASYEGELMMATGYVEYTFGREGRDKYNEWRGGVSNGSLSQFKVPVKARVNDKDGPELLKYVQNGSDPRTIVGTSDKNLMSYSFRVCLTSDPNNSVPIPEPPGYDPRDFELSRRLNLQDIRFQDTIERPWQNLEYKGYPGEILRSYKFDACCGSASVGIDAVGLAVGYATANRTQRKQFYNAHKYYVQGLMWFWVSDPSVPDIDRVIYRSYGLCKDEWPENNHFPPQLYVREAVRMIGDKVYVQQDRIPALLKCRDDSIAIADWAFDIHDMQRVAVLADDKETLIVFNEGLTSYDTGGIFVFEIPYYTLLPKRQELVNLAVPNCPSVSHVAFSAIRVEPTLWQMGQAAGTAAGIGLLEGGVPPFHDVPLNKIQASLVQQQKSFIHWPPRQHC